MLRRMAVSVVRIVVPTTALNAERTRVQRLIDDVSPDLRAWDTAAFREAWETASLPARISLLDWVRRCHARAPEDAGCARAHAHALQTLRFPWLTLMICGPWLERAGAAGRLDLSILRDAVAACLQVGRLAEAHTLLDAVRGPLPALLRPYQEALTQAPPRGNVRLFPGPGPTVAPTPFPDDPLQCLGAWLEAVENRQILLADRLFEHALAAPEEPRWAEQLVRAGLARVPSAAAWPPLDVSQAMLRALDEAGEGDPPALRASRVIRVLAHLACFHASHPEEMDENAALILRHIRAGWRPSLGVQRRVAGGR